MSETPPLLSAVGLKRQFSISAGLIFRRRTLFTAVDGVDIAVKEGEIVGVIGESGSGKSTLGRLLVRLERPNAGEIRFAGVRIDHLDEREMRPLRRRLQLIPQDSSSSLNPRRKVGAQIATPMLRFGLARTRSEAEAAVGRLLKRVGLHPEDAERYPNEFSGGQRQRINIARSLAVEAKCLILDEPTSALDVSVQAQILALLIDLKRERGLTYLFISHNLAVVQSFCERVIVMEYGRCVEQLPTQNLAAAKHRATCRLIEAVLPFGLGAADDA